MSKKRKQQKQTAHTPHPLPGFVRGQFAEVSRLIDDPNLGLTDMPKEVADAIYALTCDVGRCVARDMPELGRLTAKEWPGVYGLLSYCIEQGFALSLYRYANELRHIPEVARWTETRRQAGDKGRATQEQTKATRAARAQSMLNDGIDVAAIARELKCSIQTVYRYLKPAAAKPTLAKPRKRSARSRPR
jgi:DNA-binding CsgD family transcriptional regulator